VSAPATRSPPLPSGSSHFLDSPRLRQVLTRSDFRFSELKHGLVSVFLVLPPDRLDTYARWLRLLLAQAIQEIARDPTMPPEPVLFLLDEFAALGHLSAIEHAMGLMAGYGLQLWPILQDLNQLESLYGRKAGTFLANAGVLQAFNVNDLATARWLSELIGDATIAYETESYASSRQGFTGSVSHTTAGHLAARRLLLPDEVLRLHPELMLLRLQGRRPILASKLRYHQDPEFAGLFTPGIR
jgi:type IV secretion system protein VirD4